LFDGDLKRRYFVTVVEDQKLLTLEPIIDKLIARGSVILSEFWKANG
jgi:hypothetical protein